MKTVSLCGVLSHSLSSLWLRGRRKRKRLEHSFTESWLHSVATSTNNNKPRSLMKYHDQTHQCLFPAVGKLGGQLGGSEGPGLQTSIIYSIEQFRLF